MQRTRNGSHCADITNAHSTAISSTVARHGPAPKLVTRNECLGCRFLTVRCVHILGSATVQRFEGRVVQMSCDRSTPHVSGWKPTSERVTSADPNSSREHLIHPRYGRYRAA